MDIDETCDIKTDSVALNDKKKLLFVCFPCKKYMWGSENDSYNHICGSNNPENGDLLQCMRIVINALFYAEPTNFSTSTFDLQNSPSLRSSKFDMSSIVGNSIFEEKMHRFVTSTPKVSDFMRYF